LEVRRIDLDGEMVKMSTNSSGSVYTFDRFVGDENDFARCFAEGGRVSVRKYPRLPITQIVSKKYGGNITYYAIAEFADRLLQAATGRIVLLAALKVSDPKAIFDNSITSASFDTIVLVVKSLECIILSIILNDVWGPHPGIADQDAGAEHELLRALKDPAGAIPREAHPKDPDERPDLHADV
jgi:hypothetical protein